MYLCNNLKSAFTKNRFSEVIETPGRSLKLTGQSATINVSRIFRYSAKMVKKTRRISERRNSEKSFNGQFKV